MMLGLLTIPQTIGTSTVLLLLCAASAIYGFSTYTGNSHTDNSFAQAIMLTVNQMIVTHSS